MAAKINLDWVMKAFFFFFFNELNFYPVGN